MIGFCNFVSHIGAYIVDLLVFASNLFLYSNHPLTLIVICLCEVNMLSSKHHIYIICITISSFTFTGGDYFVICNLASIVFRVCLLCKASICLLHQLLPLLGNQSSGESTSISFSEKLRQNTRMLAKLFTLVLVEFVRYV